MEHPIFFEVADEGDFSQDCLIGLMFGQTAADSPRHPLLRENLLAAQHPCGI